MYKTIVLLCSSILEVHTELMCPYISSRCWSLGKLVTVKLLTSVLLASSKGRVYTHHLHWFLNVCQVHHLLGTCTRLKDVCEIQISTNSCCTDFLLRLQLWKSCGNFVQGPLTTCLICARLRCLQQSWQDWLH